jgi:hypothetical protein
MKRIVILILCVLAFSGCYTQFAMVNRGGPEGMPPDSVMGQDSSQSRIRDTVRIKDREVCYWTRDIWGRPELRCDDSYYGRDWYRYNNYPWWNRSSSYSYYYGDYNYYGWDERCPAYYYFDNSCGACRYYRNYQGARTWWWDSPGGSGASSTSTSSAPLRNHRSGSAGIPYSSEVGAGSSGTLQKQGGPASIGESQTGISERQGTTTTAERRRRSGSDGVPSASEITIDPARNNTPVSKEISRPYMVPEPPAQTQQQYSQPPAAHNEPAPAASPPPNNDNGRGSQPAQNSNNNDKPRERRGSRSW